MSERINIFNKRDRESFKDRVCSGDPLRDWYDETDIVIALGQALDYIEAQLLKGDRE